MRRQFAKSAARIALQAGLLASLIAAGQFQGVALGQDSSAETTPTPSTEQEFGPPPRWHPPISITTPSLGMSGWRPDPAITVTTSVMGMSGWRRDPIIVATPSLGMTGWRPDPIVINTETLGMTGWQHDPITMTTNAFGMTGWASPPEECSPPFVRDSAAGACVCPPGLLPSAEACIPADASPPYDLRVEAEGPGTCAPGKTCPFDILVVNVGDGPFHGPLAVREDTSLPAAQASTTSRGWSCAAGTCLHPVVTLAPGGSEMLTLNVRLPARTAPGARLRQCAELKMPDPDVTPVRFVQLMLTAVGIDAGPADNQMGQRTRRAIETFRRSAGLASAPGIDEPLIAALKALVPVDPHPENDRKCAEARVSE